MQSIERGCYINNNFFYIDLLSVPNQIYKLGSALAWKCQKITDRFDTSQYGITHTENCQMATCR